MDLKIFLFTIFLAIISVQSQEPPGEIDQSKCGSCPCSNPCTPPQSPPPPPALPPPPPPPKKKPPPSSNCPPPPTGGGGQSPPDTPYIFINGPPAQDLYPIDSNFSGSGRSFSAGLVPLILIFGSMIIIGFW